METQYDDATNFPGEQERLALLASRDLKKTLHCKSQSSAIEKSSFFGHTRLVRGKKKETILITSDNRQRVRLDNAATCTKTCDLCNYLLLRNVR